MTDRPTHEYARVIAPIFLYAAIARAAIAMRAIESDPAAAVVYQFALALAFAFAV